MRIFQTRRIIAARRLRAPLQAASIFVCCGVLVVAQSTDPRPAFEVATIKPSGPESGPMSLRRVPGGRLVTASTPLSMLISWAFNLDEGRLLNAPRGLGSARFDVVAQAPVAEPGPGQMQLMMQSLLAERFKLIVHNETREMTGYALMVDPGGIKVRPSTAVEPPDANPFAMPRRGHLAGNRVTAAMLANVLSNQLGRPVEDKTGLAGVFDFELRWSPDTAVASADQDLGSLYTAIREQLGFRLVARKTAVDVIVIDHVEMRPTEN